VPTAASGLKNSISAALLLTSRYYLASWFHFGFGYEELSTMANKAKPFIGARASEIFTWARI
jgi:hypothetical protein